MRDETPQGEPTGAPDGAQDAGKVAYLDQALWHSLAEAATAAEFCHGWLGLQSRMVGGASLGAVVLEDPGSGSMAPVALWPRSTPEHRALDRVVERALRERKGVVVRSEPGEEAGSEIRFHLAYPVWAHEKVRGVAALAITPRPHHQLQAAMRQLQWGVAWIQNWILRQTALPGARTEARLTAALELAAQVLEKERFHSAATSLVTELASRLDCDRVSIGFVRGSQVKVRALSHSAQFGKQMNLIRSIGMAMSESVDQGAILRYPEPEDGSHHVLQAHDQLARGHGDRAVCTVPFHGPGGTPLGALTFERAADEPFDDHTVELCDTVGAMAGPILEEKRRNDRLLIVKAGDSLRIQSRKLLGPRHMVAKLVALGVVALALFFTFARGDYRVTAKTTLEGEIQRAVVAPFRGYISEAPIRGGDIVEKGQVLATLDERDLRLEYSRWSTEREQYLVERQKAMAEGDVAGRNVLEKKIAQAEAQLALLDEQLNRARIVAPFDGVVISGDLSQSLGAPVETGEVLFEITPLDSYRVMLQVDEHDINEIREGQPGRLILTAMPGDELTFTVSKITPVAMSEEGTNFFLVEGKLEQSDQRLRPGMEGFGKIRVDRRRLIWIWTHDIFDWIRLRAWTWLP